MCIKNSRSNSLRNMASWFFLISSCLGFDRLMHFYHSALLGPDAPPRGLNVTASSSGFRIAWEAPAILSGPTSYLVQVTEFHCWWHAEHMMWSTTHMLVFSYVLPGGWSQCEHLHNQSSGRAEDDCCDEFDCFHSLLRDRHGVHWSPAACCQGWESNRANWISNSGRTYVVIMMHLLLLKEGQQFQM